MNYLIFTMKKSALCSFIKVRGSALLLMFIMISIFTMIMIGIGHNLVPKDGERHVEDGSGGGYFEDFMIGILALFILLICIFVILLIVAIFNECSRLQIISSILGIMTFLLITTGLGHFLIPQNMRVKPKVEMNEYVEDFLLGSLILMIGVIIGLIPVGIYVCCREDYSSYKKEYDQMIKLV